MIFRDNEQDEAADYADFRVSFSRIGKSNYLGKCDNDLTVYLPEPTKDALRRLAAVSDKPTAEYTRDVLLTHVHGAASVMRNEQFEVKPDELIEALTVKVPAGVKDFLVAASFQQKQGLADFLTHLLVSYACGEFHVAKVHGLITDKK